MTSLPRRSFLRAAGGSALLAHWLRGAVAHAQDGQKPKRFMILHRPSGTIDENWIKNGIPGSILQPFSGVWQHAVAVRGVDVRPSNGTTYRPTRTGIEIDHHTRLP